jgi:hypothetical protein
LDLGLLEGRSVGLMHDIAGAGERGAWVGPSLTQVPADMVGCNAAQCQLAKLITSDRAPAKTRLKAQVASRLNQLRDTNLRPK